MSDRRWEDQVRDFLFRTSEDIKRAGVEIRQEAKKLLSEMKDEKGQAKVREGLHQVGTWAKKTADGLADVVESTVKRKDVGDWARKTAENVAGVVDTTVRRAEGVLARAAEKVNAKVATPPPQAGVSTSSSASAVGYQVPAPEPRLAAAPPDEQAEAPAPKARPRAQKAGAPRAKKAKKGKKT